MTWRRQGLPLVHFSAQPVPISSLESPKPPPVSLDEFSRQAEKWTSVSPWSAVSTRWLELLVDFAAAAAAGGPRVAAASSNSLTAAAARSLESFGLASPCDGSGSSGGHGHGPGGDEAPATCNVPVLGLVPAALRRRGAVFNDLAVGPGTHRPPCHRMLFNPRNDGLRCV